MVMHKNVRKVGSCPRNPEGQAYLLKNSLHKNEVFFYAVILRRNKDEIAFTDLNKLG